MNFRISLVQVFILYLSILFFSCSEEATPEEPRKILVFSKTAGFRHVSIEDGIDAIKKIGAENDFQVDTTENADRFNENNLQQYSAVVFLNTTGDVLNHEQEVSLQRFIQAGGGFIGVHSATDTEYSWPWYGKMVGAYFESHPEIQQATVNILDRQHPSTEHLQDKWQRTDEWYNFKNINPDVKVLAELDESTYKGGKNKDNHPIVWYHEFDGGRAFYTGFGHTRESYQDPDFIKHLQGGIQWAIGEGKLDYNEVTTAKVPEEDRFSKVVLAEKLNEPKELSVLKDGRVIYIERHGNVVMYSPKTNSVKTIAKIPVFSSNYYASGRKTEDGLLGLAVDPDFERNNWIYLYYSPIDPAPLNVLSRFILKGDDLDLRTEVKILEVPVQRDECCHTGGSITFDAQGNLYLSTGDNSNPFDSKYSPIDERPHKKPWDVQRSSGNTNDLRGKILRIKPQADGTYTIPEGNLFSNNEQLTKPEIYVMGNRNPYRISVDQKTGFLYWGEVGPDAREDSVSRGPKGHDEINQAKKAGNFGWPHFVGDNKAYRRYNYSTKQPGEFYDAQKPENTSVNNTGKKVLPPAQKAFIWYPSSESPEFPMVGTGGRTAMAGPVYYSDLYDKSEHALPDYFNGKLFIYEWIRGWIKVVTLDEEGNFQSMEPFMASTKFDNPIDMEMAPDGTIYMLEYGNPLWFGQNDNSRLIRIEYNAGNRAPKAQIAADVTVGADPLTVSFSSEGTFDPDGDQLRYQWRFMSQGGVHSTEKNPQFTYGGPGIFRPSLTVIDKHGDKQTQEIEIKVGNAPPQVDIIVAGNNSFYWDNRNIEYQVQVKDTEDGELQKGSINQQDVIFNYEYRPQRFLQTMVSEGHQEDGPTGVIVGKRLIENSDCKSCHDLQRESVGPAYTAVAEKYKGDPEAVNYLTSKVINGGGGVWGERVMTAHPNLSKQDATEMVNYILSLSEEGKQVASLPLQGGITADDHLNEEEKGTYVLTAAYSDKGANNIGPLTTHRVIALRHPVVRAEHHDHSRGTTTFRVDVKPSVEASNNSYIGFDNIDLSGIQNLTVGYSSKAEGGKITVRSGSLTGEALGEASLGRTNDIDQWSEVNIPLKVKNEIQNLYFVFTNDQVQNNSIFNVDWIRFNPADVTTTRR